MLKIKTVKRFVFGYLEHNGILKNNYEPKSFFKVLITCLLGILNLNVLILEFL